MCLKAPRWLWLSLVGYVLVHFDVWLALVLFKRCPGEVSFGDIFTQPARRPKSSNSWIFSVRHVWNGPWWILLIEKWSVMLHLVVWERLTLVNVDMRELCNTTFATDGQNPTFTFPWNNDRNWSAPTAPLGHFWLKNFHLLAQYPLFMYNLRKISFWIFWKTFILTDRPLKPNDQKVKNSDFSMLAGCVWKLPDGSGCR